ncbi:MAG TPA: hypothetical protein V6D15_04415 [Oculatellaceae cyanobacterium]|jgi:hypothetical protein
MVFKKQHKLGAKPLYEEPMDRSPVCFNVKVGVKEKLKNIPDWKERLREFVNELIEDVDKQ